MKKILVTLVWIVLVINEIFALTPQEYMSKYRAEINAGNYENAFNVAAQYYNEHHITDACYRMAECYYRGIGTERNLALARDFYKAVYDSPDVNANSPLDLRQQYGYCSRMYAELDLYLSNREKANKEDFKPYFKAIEISDDPSSLYVVGKAYLTGQIGKEDLSLAKSYLNRAANYNSIAALSTLGFISEYHQQDTEKAFEFYYKAANTPIYKLANSEGNEYFVNPNSEELPTVIELKNLALYKVGNMLFESESYEESSYYLNQISDMQDLKSAILACRSNICSKNYEKALGWADVALTIEPDNGWAYFYKGLVYAKLDRIKDCEDMINKSISLGCIGAEEFKDKYLK